MDHDRRGSREALDGTHRRSDPRCAHRMAKPRRARNDGAVLFTWVDAGTTEIGSWWTPSPMASSRAPAIGSGSSIAGSAATSTGSKRSSRGETARRVPGAGVPRRRGDRPSRWIGGRSGSERTRPPGIPQGDAPARRRLSTGVPTRRPPVDHVGLRSPGFPGDPWCVQRPPAYERCDHRPEPLKPAGEPGTTPGSGDQPGQLFTSPRSRP